MKIYMAMGPVNVPSGGSADGSVPLDDGSTVTFSFGCDAGGMYIITPDETNQGGSE